MSKNRGASGLKPTVLFADGDAVWRNICLTFLGDCGYTVETASSGLECIEILRRRTPAIVVVDFQLPWGGGDGVLAWLRSETFSPEAPVILTADARFAPGLFQDIEPSGVQILIKPYSVTTLLEFLLAAEACNDGRNENRRRAPFARHAM